MICSQVIDELTEMMNMNKEQVEKTVHESKCDELSAMFNMMMDNKRKDKGRSSIINHRMQKPHVKGSFWKIKSYLAFKLCHWFVCPHLTLKHFFLFKKWCFQCYDNDVIGCYNVVLEFMKRSSAKLWQIGIDLCLKYCKCLTNDISDDFVKLLCRGIWPGLHKLPWKEKREKRT